jgi:hypothetical protein
MHSCRKPVFTHTITLSFASANPICTRLPPLSISEYNNRSDILELSAVCPASKHKSSMVDPSSSTESLFGTSGGLFTQRSPLNSGPSQNFLNSSPLEQAESTSATIDTIAVRRSRSTQTSISVSMTADALVGVFPTESEKTRRARYAANQRHSKAREARKDSHHADSINEAKTLDQELKQRHREKNKVAAAKCRSRQRKQVQTIQEKGSRLGERNLALKVMIQELRRELSSLRSMALDHQQCSCNVAQYNLTQADRIAAEYRLSCFRQQF